MPSLEGVRSTDSVHNRLTQVIDNVPINMDRN